MKRKLVFSMVVLILRFFSDLSAKSNNPDYLLNCKKTFIIKSLKEATSEDDIKGKIMITAGTGFNIFGTILETRYNFSYNYILEWPIASYQSSPMYNIMLDYGIAKKFSVGTAFGYQTATINFNDGNHSDSWTRVHMAIRGDYYIIAKEKISFYTGLKLGYNIYTVTSNISPSAYPEYIENLGVTPNPASVQAHLGFSYYFNGMVGLNTEVGLGYGGPYLLAVGLTVKI